MLVGCAITATILDRYVPIENHPIKTCFDDAERSLTRDGVEYCFCKNGTLTAVRRHPMQTTAPGKTLRILAESDIQALTLNFQEADRARKSIAAEHGGLGDAGQISVNHSAGTATLRYECGHPDSVFATYVSRNSETGQRLVREAETARAKKSGR